MKKSVTVKTFHDTREYRKRKKDGKYPIELRVYCPYPKEQRRYCIELYATIEDYKRAMGKRPRGEAAALFDSMQQWEADAKKVINRLDDFSFYQFESQMDLTKNGVADVYAYYNKIIKEQTKDGNIGTAINYTCSRNALYEFLERKRVPTKREMTALGITEYKFPNLSFTAITAKKLESFEKWMLSNDKGDTTVSMYMRSLRAVFNAAIADESISKSIYPFGADRGKYQIPSGGGIKRTLKNDVMHKLKIFKAEEGTQEKEGYDWWWFIYQANGANTKDFALWRYSDMLDDMIVFYRAKVRRTSKKKRQLIKVILTDHIRRHIELYGNTKTSANDFIFPIISDEMTAREQYDAIQAKTKWINKRIKKFAIAAGVDKLPTTYFARHTRASKIIETTGNIHNVKNELGHSSALTSEIYVDTLENVILKSSNSKLMDFTPEHV